MLKDNPKLKKLFKDKKRKEEIDVKNKRSTL